MATPVPFRSLQLSEQIKLAALWPYYGILGGDLVGLAVGAGYMYYMGTLQFAGVPWSAIAMNILQAGIPVYIYDYAMNVPFAVGPDGSAMASLGGSMKGLTGRMSLGGQASASLAPGMSYAPGPMMG